jgi:hypothetical protein
MKTLLTIYLTILIFGCQRDFPVTTQDIDYSIWECDTTWKYNPSSKDSTGRVKCTDQNDNEKIWYIYP